MRNNLTIVCKIFVFLTLLRSSQANNCSRIDSTEIISASACEDELFVIDGEECTLGNGQDSIAIVCVNDEKCAVKNRTDSTILCTACIEGWYGSNCTESALCASGCSYSRNKGCVSSAAPKECNLLDLKISSPSELNGTKYITKEIPINVTVNLAESDVNVTVSAGPDDLPLMNVTNEGLYMYKFDVEVHRPGKYSFTATALQNQNATTIIDVTEVMVIVYVPIKIYAMKAKYNTGEEKTIEGNTVFLDVNQNITELTCFTEGVGAIPDQVSWMENGGEISLVSTGNNLYQYESKNGTETTATLKFHEGKNSEGPYADKSDFIIAVCVLGVALLFSIIVFGLALLYKSKPAYSATTNKRANQYIGNQNKSFNHLDNLPHKGDQTTSEPGQNNYISPHQSRGVAKERPTRPTTTTPANRKPTQLRTGQGQYEPAREPNIPQGRPQAEIPGHSRQGQVLTRSNDRQHPLYDEVADKPKLPERNTKEDEVYVQPHDNDQIYEDTIP